MLKPNFIIEYNEDLAEKDETLFTNRNEQAETPLEGTSADGKEEK